MEMRLIYSLDAYICVDAFACLCVICMSDLSSFVHLSIFLSFLLSRFVFVVVAVMVFVCANKEIFRGVCPFSFYLKMTNLKESGSENENK